MEEPPTLFGILSEFHQELSLAPLKEDVEADINGQDESSNTSLHRALEESKEAEVDPLLLRNINLNVRNKQGKTPLMVVVECGSDVLVEMFIKKGANVNSENISYVYKPIDLGSVVVGCNQMAFSQTALQLAIVKNFESIVDKLIKAGADVNISSGRFGTPMEAALTTVNLNIARKLLDHGALLCPHSVFSSLLKCHKKDLMVLMDFVFDNGFSVNTVGYMGWTLLHLAVIRQNVTFVKKLLQKGANINAKDFFDEKPLHAAARLTNYPTFKLLLLENKSNNKIGWDLEQVLCVAAASNRKDYVRLILNSGALTTNALKANEFKLLKWGRGASKQITSYILGTITMQLANVRINLARNNQVLAKHYTSNLSNFEESCRQELDQIKAKMFGNVSLYDVFTEREPNTIPAFAVNSEIKDYLRSVTLKSEFPLYSGLLRKTSREGMLRYNLLNQHLIVRLGQSSVAHIVLPLEISRIILDLLEDCDLLNVKRAFRHYY